MKKIISIQLNKRLSQLQFTQSFQKICKHNIQSIKQPVLDILNRKSKRIRPLIILLMTEALKLQKKKIYDICSIVQILHNGSLVIDDIQDDSQYRRQLKCIHKIYGVDIAINAGNYMFFSPLSFFLNSQLYTLQNKVNMCKIYANQMINLHLGQGTDILWHNHLYKTFPTYDQYILMVKQKTGSLTMLGLALLCQIFNIQHQKKQAILQFGSNFGISFQINDDINNLEGYNQGKKIKGQDIDEGKISLMIIDWYKKADNDVKQRVLSLLREKRKKSDDQKYFIINQLIKTNSINYGKQQTKKWRNFCWNRIQPIIEQSQAKTILQQLTLLIK